MKIVKVRIGITTVGAERKYTYPPEYDSNKINVLAYEHIGASAEMAARGGKDEYCIGIVQDGDLAGFIASADIVEITQAQAIVDGHNYRPQIERIINPAKVLAVINNILADPTARAAIEKALTLDDMNALDSNHADAGINKSELFSDKLTRTLP